MDRLFSSYIRQRAGNKCEWCTQPKKVLHCHHGVVGRRYLRTRFESDNAVCVCYSCHNFLEDHPSIDAEFFVKRIGSDRVEELIRMAHSNYPVDKNAILADLKEKLKELL